MGVGAEWAAEFARCFLHDTAENVQAAGIPLSITTTEVTAPELLELGVPVVDQGAGDLGARLEHVLQRGLRSADRVMALGADCPGIPPERFQRAFRSEHTAIMPTEDGGFALLALSKCPDGLFAGLPWSMPHTCVAMIERLESVGMRVERVGQWFDVDRVEDLERLEHLEAAPRSRAALLRMRSSSTSGTTTGPLREDP